MSCNVCHRSEEYEPDARKFYEAKEPKDVDSSIQNYMRYFNVYPAEIKNVTQYFSLFKPYKVSRLMVPIYSVCKALMLMRVYRCCLSYLVLIMQYGHIYDRH